jgi:hypothetical protein
MVHCRHGRHCQGAGREHGRREWVIDRWASSAIDDKTRETTLALELARLDEFQETLYARPRQGDVQCGALVTKIIERRCVMLVLHTPQTAVLPVVEASRPRETNTDRIEAALNALLMDQRNGGGEKLN